MPTQEQHLAAINKAVEEKNVFAINWLTAAFQPFDRETLRQARCDALGISMETMADEDE